MQSDTSNYFHNEIILSVEGERRADLVGRAGRSNVVQSLSVQSKTKRGLHAWPESLSVTCIPHESHETLCKVRGHTKSKDARIVYLGLDECSRVKEAEKKRLDKWMIHDASMRLTPWHRLRERHQRLWTWCRKQPLHQLRRRD